ncbi:MAG: ATP-binding cassette domain-containing protein, partial [Phycisphaerae bacterium]|nr:ATP-binding cassette domain-containing protein [Phycisphaerae bacterium]
DFAQSASEVHNRIRGLSPSPGAWFEVMVDGRPERIKVLKSSLAGGRGAPGEVLDGELTIACGDGAIRPVLVQRAGRRPVATAELLRGLGLWERRGERVGTWSRGMKQKLAVARAVLHRPPLVFLDEPTAGLDPVASATLRDDIERLARDEGVTVFLTTHNLQEAERLCASVGVIRRGTLLAVGSPADLRAQRSTSVVRVQARSWPPEVRAALGTHPAVRAVADDAGTLRLTLHHPDATPELVRWLVGHGLDLEAVT